MILLIWECLKCKYVCCLIPGSLGVRVIGGNHVGIFVSAVQEDSPAALNLIRPADKILSVNGKSMLGVTREEVLFLH